MGGSWPVLLPLLELSRSSGSRCAWAAARPGVYEVGDGGFLVGSVPGCDLRLPGANLPPVLCLIARQAGGVSLRKLAPVQPIAVNGRPVSAAYLADGDRVGVGAAEIAVAIAYQQEEAAPPASPLAQLEERLRLIEARETALREQAERVEADRKSWDARREAVEAECGRQAARLAELRSGVEQFTHASSASRGDLELREKVCRQLQEECTRKEADLAARGAELARREAEVGGLGQELTRLRNELGDRFGQRRDRILAQQQALHKAAQKVQRRKRDLDERQATVEELERGWPMRQAELDARAEQVERERRMLDEQHAALAARQQEAQRGLAKRLDEIVAREKADAGAEAALAQGQKQHQADLVRLDRIQAGIEARQKQLEGRALEVDRKFEQLQRDTRDLEEQAAGIDEHFTRLNDERERIDALAKVTEGKAAEVEGRAAALEGQQTMLATLRTRLERIREDLHRQEQALSDQRVLQEAGEADLAERRAEAEQIRAALVNDRDLFDQERRRYDERRATLEQAVAQLRQTQASLAQEQAEAESRRAALDATAAEQAEQANLLLARGEQLEQMADRLQADRQATRDREESLTRAEQMLATLQEHVRKRVEECEALQKGMDGRVSAVAAREAECAEASARLEAETAERHADAERLIAELGAQTSAIEQQRAALAKQEQALAFSRMEVVQVQSALSDRTQALAAERVAWEVEQQAALDHQRKMREEFEQSRDEAQLLVRLLPDLEVRAKAAQQAMERAREQLREHLGEIHEYSRQSREELESARRHMQSEEERVRQQDLELRVARDEHRLAVAAFRQQLIEWQGRVGDMRQMLQTNNSQLEIKQADLDVRARQMEDAGARLAQEAEQLERQKRQVAERRGEVDRHLSDMREWYRRKIRELAGVDAPAEMPGEGDVLPLPPAASPGRPATPRDPARAVLTLEDDLEPADRELGVMLATLGLIDDDTRQALWSEARRQRRSLRQLLLAGGYLTLYQLALIEAGNLDGLVLGPVRVIDKLSSGPREAVYRVFDPRHNAEAVLRHLAEAEMHDAVRPDEFRQRFLAASAVRHELIAGVLEVLTIADRPAALVEWVDGVPAADLSGHAASPVVWYRLLTQAAMGLHIAHSAGLCHGRLDGHALVLTPRGVLKLVGLGEPHWLAGADEADDSPAGDLWALGQVAAAWAAPAPGAKPSKAKALPDALASVLDRLQAEDPAERFASAAEVLSALEAAGPTLSANAAAWDRLLRQTREQVGGRRGGSRREAGRGLV